jgi:outer membrane biosynthesis protein TonB
VPSVVIVVVKVSRQGKTLAVRTRQASNEPSFTTAVENYVQALTWTPAVRDGVPVDGWTQAAFMPDSP